MKIFRNFKAFGRKTKLFILLCAMFVVGSFIFLTGFSSQVHSIMKEYERLRGTYMNTASWVSNNHTSCDGNFIGYGHQFAVLKNAMIQPRDELFYLSCRHFKELEYHFDSGKEGTHLNRWLHIIKNKDESAFKVKTDNTYGIMVAVKRYEYANMYHTMTDWYNVFLVTKLLNISANNISILLFDNSPKGHMDDTWKILFGSVIQLPSLNENIYVTTLVWNILGYESPMNYHGLTHLPYVEDFHKFFLKKHNIHHGQKQLDCEKMSIFFLWRRDYVAHPGNENGEIKRKISNEDELMQIVRDNFKGAQVHGDNLDRLPFHEQLKIISSTDILVSMHGAGLSHVLFLPSHAGVVELFPLYWMKYPGMVHFEAMSRWRGLRYTSWQNWNPTNELEHWKTYIPPAVLLFKVNSVYEQICSRKDR